MVRFKLVLVCSWVLVFHLEGQESAGRTPAGNLPPPERKATVKTESAPVASVEAARRLADEGNAPGAKAILLRADSLGLLAADDLLLLATLHFQAGEFPAATARASDALGLFNKEIEKRPMEASFYRSSGICYLVMNDLARAETEFVRFINRSGESGKSESIAALQKLSDRGVNIPDADYILKKYFLPPQMEPGSVAGRPGTAEKDEVAPRIVILVPEQARGLSLTEVETYRIPVVGLAADNVGVSVVRVNGSPATLREAAAGEISSSGLTGRVVKFETEAMLTIGDNQIEVEAVDVAGNTSRRFVGVKRRPEQVARKVETKLPTIWAVVIGISRYAERSLELRFANKDAQSFYGFLKSPGGGAVPDRQIDLLLDRNATRADIIQSINSKLRMAYDDDQVIIYIACHGIPDEVSGELYFLGYDADPKNIPGTGISQSDIQKAIATARAKKVIVIADACHSGSITLPPTMAARGNAAYLTNKLLKGLTEVRSGIAMLTASSANEFSREGENWDGHGVFTYHLVRGLKGPADRNNDGTITIREIHEYVYRMVVDDTKGAQHPDLQGRFENEWPMSVVK